MVAWPKLRLEVDNQTRPSPHLDTAELKRQQLAMRQAEIEETLHILRVINDGRGASVAEQNLRRDGVNLRNWQGRLDFDHVVVAGHSYGATLAVSPSRALHISDSLMRLSTATSTQGRSLAIDALQRRDHSRSVRASACAHEPLGFTDHDNSGKHSGPLNDNIDVPTLIIHSNSWSKTHSIFFGRPHFDVIKALAQKILSRGHAAWFVTSRTFSCSQYFLPHAALRACTFADEELRTVGTTHASITDAPFIEPMLLKLATGSTTSAPHALQQYVAVSVEFVRFLKTGVRTGVLASGVTHPEYNTKARNEAQKETAASDEIRDAERHWQVHVKPGTQWGPCDKVLRPTG